MTTDVATKPDEKSLAKYVEHESIQKVLARRTRSEAEKRTLVSGVISIVQKSYLLQKCAPNTILSAALQASMLDLPIEPSLGQAYIVPYKGKAQFQIGYRGLIQLSLRSQRITRMNAMPIYKGMIKKFDLLRGEIELDYEFEPADGEKAIGYLAYLEVSNGPGHEPFQKVEYWTRARVEKHAKRFSQAYRNDSDGTSPWSTDFDPMAIKTVLKSMILTYAPMTTELQQAVVVDQSVSDLNGKEVEYPDAPDYMKDDKVQEGEFTEQEKPAVKKTAKKRNAKKQAAPKPDGITNNNEESPAGGSAQSDKADAGAKEEGTNPPDKTPASGQEEEKPKPPAKPEDKGLPPTIGDLSKMILQALEVNEVPKEQFFTYLRGLGIMSSDDRDLMDLSGGDLLAINDMIDNHIEDCKAEQG